MGSICSWGPPGNCPVCPCAKTALPACPFKVCFRFENFNLTIGYGDHNTIIFDLIINFKKDINNCI